MRNEHKAQSFIAFFTSTSLSIIMVFNTGETSEELKAKYNPEGSLLRRVQLRMLDMLLYFDTVCKEQHISYRLEGGTVLGAVRHGGFIPWDDDLDVAIDSKEDYKKLIQYFKQHPHEQFVLQNKETDPGFYNYWFTIRDLKSEYVHQNEETAKLDMLRKYRGLQIDVFPFETKELKGFNSFSRYVSRFRSRFLLVKHHHLSELVYRLQKYILHPFFRGIGFLFGSKRLYRHSYGSPFMYAYSSDALFPYKNVTFEGHEFPAPANTDAYLREHYGEYMDLPSADKRNPHNVTYNIWE